MRCAIEIEDIAAVRSEQGINDADFREQVGRLKVGDHVRLTFLADVEPPIAETLRVRITRRKRTPSAASSPGGPPRPRSGTCTPACWSTLPPTRFIRSPAWDPGRGSGGRGGETSGVGRRPPVVRVPIARTLGGFSMLTDLTVTERCWLRDGMTEELIEQIRRDPSLKRFALFHLEGIRWAEPPACPRGSPGLGGDDSAR